MANRFAVRVDGTNVQTNISRKEARQLVASLKAEGKKAKVIDLQASEDAAACYAQGAPPATVARDLVTEAGGGMNGTVITEEMPDGTPVGTPGPSPDFSHSARFFDLGLSVALADLAAAKSLEIDYLATCDHLLSEAGIDRRELTATIIRNAVKLERDRIDAMLWRTEGRRVGEVAPAPTRADANQRIAVVTAPVVRPTPSAAPRATAAPKAPGKPRSMIFELAATKVVMWMGKNGYKADQVTKVLAHFGVTSTPASIATFIRSGIKGDRGPVPTLTEQQAQQIAAAANGR